MIWAFAAIALVAIVVALVELRRQKPAPPLDPEAALKAAVELHRIRRKLDVAYTQSEQRQEASLLEHRIVEIVSDDGTQSPD